MPLLGKFQIFLCCKLKKFQIVENRLRMFQGFADSGITCNRGSFGKLIDLSAVAQRLSELHQQYDTITRGAEDLLTRQADYREALAKQRERQDHVSQRLAAEQTVAGEPRVNFSQHKK